MKKIIMVFLGVCAFLLLGNVEGYVFYEKVGSSSILGKTATGQYSPKLDEDEMTDIYSTAHNNGIYSVKAIKAFTNYEGIYSEEIKYLQSNILSSTDYQTNYGLWCMTARLYEITLEIKQRIERRADIDYEDLLFYKTLLIKASPESEVISGIECPDDYPYKDEDLLYQMGCHKYYHDSPKMYPIRSSIVGFDKVISLDNYAAGTPIDLVTSLIDFDNESRDYYIKWTLLEADKVLTKVNGLMSSYLPKDDNQQDGEAEGEVEIDIGAQHGDNWWGAAVNFFNSGKNSSAAAPVNNFISSLDDMIFFIGNIIFIIVTSVLGVKYIFASAGGKAQVKDSLVTLVVAALFFYGWESIANLLNFKEIFSADTYQNAITPVYNTILFIINLLAVCGIIWIGVKYMLSGAEGKANMKANWVPVIVGIIMVYGTIWFLTTILQIVFTL